MLTRELLLGDCVEVLRGLADCSVDSIVTDPPYGLSFMGKKWDYDVPSEDVWRECLRVLKPGGHLLAFAGTRTQHRMAVRIEDAGFEIRDMIAWVYGSGFPKSLDVSKAIDKAAGAEREVVGEKVTGRALGGSNWRDGDAGGQETVTITAPATPEAQQWQGWGTALKPSWECITVARKPFACTVAANVLEHGTGAINVDACRINAEEQLVRPAISRADNAVLGKGLGAGVQAEPSGRWPANLIHDGSEEVLGLFPVTKSPTGTTVRTYGTYKTVGGASNRRPCHDSDRTRETVNGFGDSGSAARFFYCAKASKRDRDEGLDNSPDRFMAASNQAQAQLKRGIIHESESGVNTVKIRKNNHPTVKPTDLMRYLCRLVTPPGGIVLDPFMGSGSTGKAAMLEGFQFIGIERDKEYMKIAEARIKAQKCD